MSKKQTEELSKSKAKRQERQKEVSKAKRHKLIGKIVGIVVTVVIIAAIVAAVGLQIYKVATRTTTSSDFSAGLNEDGTIADIDVSKSITLADYENLVVPMSEVQATDEEVDSDINSTLSANQEVSDDSSLEIADGDKVNIDYVGTIDGEEFEGGSATGYDLTIGSNTFIDDFETQLIGHKPGEEVTVEVTFPGDYSTNTELAGKDASFAVTINGIYVTPELTDEFVQAHLSDQASTAEEYRQVVKDKFYKQHLEDYLTNYVDENSAVNSYPKAYLKNVKGLLKYDDEYTLSYYNQMFSQYGVDTYENIWDSKDGINNEIEYERDLTKRAKETVKTAMVYQAIYEKAGLSIDMDAYLADLTETNGEDYVNNMKTTYGTAYMAQTHIKEVVTDYLMENANVQ